MLGKALEEDREEFLDIRVSSHIYAIHRWFMSRITRHSAKGWDAYRHSTSPGPCTICFISSSLCVVATCMAFIGQCCLMTLMISL